MTTGGLATGEAVNTRAVDLHATDTRVWCTHWGTLTQRDGNTQSGVSLVPTDEQRMAYKQSTEWGAATAIKKARSTWFCATDSTSSYFWLQKTVDVAAEKTVVEVPDVEFRFHTASELSDDTHNSS